MTRYCWSCKKELPKGKKIPVCKYCEKKYKEEIKKDGLAVTFVGLCLWALNKKLG